VRVPSIKVLVVCFYYLFRGDSSGSVPLKLALVIDTVTSNYRLHYREQVQYYYEQTLYNVRESWTDLKGRVVGPITTKQWLPSEGGGGAIQSRALQSELQKPVNQRYAPYVQK